MEVDNHETGLDPVFTSGSQSTIRYSSNSTMEDNLDDSADTTSILNQLSYAYRSNSAMEEDLDNSADTTDGRRLLNTDTKLQQKLRQRAKRKEQRKIARLQNPRLNTHDKDEMS